MKVKQFDGAYWEIHRYRGKLLCVVEIRLGNEMHQRMVEDGGNGRILIVRSPFASVFLHQLDALPEVDLPPEYAPQPALPPEKSKPVSVADVIVDYVRAETRYAVSEARVAREATRGFQGVVSPGTTQRDEAERRLRSMLEDFFPTLR